MTHAIIPPKKPSIVLFGEIFKALIFPILLPIKYANTSLILTIKKRKVSRFLPLFSSVLIMYIIRIGTTIKSRNKYFQN